MVRRNSDIRRWSRGTLTSGGGPAELQRQAVVRRNSDVRRWSGGTPIVSISQFLYRVMSIVIRLIVFFRDRGAVLTP
ncbi:hypothetical protein IEQ34_015196 [Dendrobium chrysotoxum]|uniref:Uncharacterized protein n=1 Tax=Dendrobium chrysotoxum TaxID=161865 RepID=A0AAV7GHQ6_DENCH|nr:hypothetical protein IEQ34_015196 [Dendrobium chrysotoxum]